MLFLMLDEQSEHKQERSSQLAVAVGLLLFASVVLGSGVLGDAGDSRLADGTKQRMTQALTGRLTEKWH